MSDYNANIGNLALKEVVVLAGPGPHFLLNEALAAGLAELPAGALVGLDAARQVVPFGVARELAIGQGDAAETAFSASLGPLVPGGLSVGDGSETFSDDGFGGLVGDAGGSGKVNYQTGALAVTFHAAPAEAAPVSASYQPVLHGVLTRRAEPDAAMASVCVFGQVNRAQLTVEGVVPDDAQVRALCAKQIWPLG